ncbi:MAG: GNAT family N-acetyltransferase [candidate division WOR-3 bacterium]
MSPYYEWDAKKDKFVRCPKPPKKNIKVRLRLANNRDKKLLLDFERECVRTEPEVFIDELKYYRKRLRLIPKVNFSQKKNFKVVIALINHKIVGQLAMAWYFCYETNSKVGVITGLWVLKPYRMAGIGRKLITFAKKEFKKWGVKRITLVVGISNLAAKEFYKKCGFKIRRIDEAIYENGN